MALLWKPGQDRYLIVSAREGQSERKRFYTIEGKAKLGKRITIEAAFFVDEGDRDFVLALRRQLAELRRTLETIRMLSQPNLSGGEWEKIDSLLPEPFSQIDIFKAIHKQARATLDRVGCECETCKYSQLNPDGGHCYMFKEKPARRCAQWQQARVGGGGYEVAE